MGFFDGIGKPIKKSINNSTKQTHNKATISSFKGIKVIYGPRSVIGHYLESDGGYKTFNGVPTILLVDTKIGDKRILNHEYAHYLWHKKLGSKKKLYWTQSFNKYRTSFNVKFQFATEEYFAIYYAYIKTGIIPSHQARTKVIPELVKVCKIISGD